MRGQELLAALALRAPGIEIHMGVQGGKNFASVATLYEPETRATGATLFNAAFEVARQLLQHPQTPREVVEALEEYDQHTEILRL